MRVARLLKAQSVGQRVCHHGHHPVARRAMIAPSMMKRKMAFISVSAVNATECTIKNGEKARQKIAVRLPPYRTSRRSSTNKPFDWWRTPFGPRYRSCSPRFLGTTPVSTARTGTRPTPHRGGISSVLRSRMRKLKSTVCTSFSSPLRKLNTDSYSPAAVKMCCV